MSPPLDGSESSARASVEVLLCTYNGSAFVAEQLDSILRQTRPVDRIVVRDDGSSDGTLDEVRRCLQRHAAVPEVVLVRNPVNLGFAANFAAGIADACCDVVFPCDQDDVWERDKVATLLELLARSGADLAFSDGTPVDSSGRPLPGPTVLQALHVDTATLDDFGARAWDELMRRNVVNGASCAVRRVAAQAALPLPTGMPHDQWLALWCAADHRVVATAQRLYRYRQHGGNAIGMGSARRLYRWLGVWRQPRRPRRRELALWRGVAQRLAPRVSDDRAASLRAKLRFLEEVVADPRAPSRGAAIVRHGLKGSYRRYAPEGALARDLVGLLRDPEPKSTP